MFRIQLGFRLTRAFLCAPVALARGRTSCWYSNDVSPDHSTLRPRTSQLDKNVSEVVIRRLGLTASACPSQECR